MNFAQFVERYPKSKRFSAVYGPDEYLVHTAKVMIEKDLAVDPLDVKVFEFPKQFSAFCDALHEQPLAGPRQLVVGVGFDSVYDKLAKVDFKGSVPRSTYVLVTSAADKLDTKNDFAQLCISRGWWIWARPLDPDQNVDVLHRMFNVPKSLADQMVETFGSLARVVSESKKLRMLGMMNSEGFNQYSAFVAASEDDYVDKLFVGDTEGALRVMRELLIRGDSAARIIGMVTYKVEQVVRVIDGQSSGTLTYADLAKHIGVPVPFLDRVVRRSKKTTVRKLVRMLRILERYDLQMRAGYKDEMVLIPMSVELSGGA